MYLRPPKLWWQSSNLTFEQIINKRPLKHHISTLWILLKTESWAEAIQLFLIYMMEKYWWLSWMLGKCGLARYKIQASNSDLFWRRALQHIGFPMEWWTFDWVDLPVSIKWGRVCIWCWCHWGFLDRSSYLMGNGWRGKAGCKHKLGRIDQNENQEQGETLLS